ncbi:hypothetical protein FHR87_001146 [Azomonas macrocytogenes]|uniref:Uncharacterized protein n=1 Tax=Azomonas macrocytogenes TaxID=69962 RepID=A0A839T0V9_AZOMA|nr:hypothetical protein [Azomonas macrocytogenes]
MPSKERRDGATKVVQNLARCQCGRLFIAYFINSSPLYILRDRFNAYFMAHSLLSFVNL